MTEKPAKLRFSACTGELSSEATVDGDSRNLRSFGSPPAPANSVPKRPSTAISFTLKHEFFINVEPMRSRLYTVNK